MKKRRKNPKGEKLAKTTFPTINKYLIFCNWKLKSKGQTLLIYEDILIGSMNK